MALLEENPKEEVEEKLQESNPIIVLTGNDDDDDEDGDAPIGLSVRQPSFASLHGNVIPKGGIESAAMKLVIEEVPETKAEEDSNPKSSGRVEEENIGMQARQSSYANLHFNTSPDLEPNKIEPIIEPEEPQQKDVIENPVIVLTAEDEKDDDAPIGLSVRQPSFASLHGNVIPKGGFTSSVPLIENIAEEPAKTQEDNNKSEIRLTEADSSTKEKILTSLHEFNKEWWEEIGYKPADKDFHRNNSCFILQNSKPVEKPKSNIKCCASLYQQNGSNTHGMNIVRGPSLVRVNSFGNKTEVKTVEMPIPDVELENDMSENIDEIEEEEEGHHDEFEDENDLMTDYSDEREEQSPLKPLPVNRGPSLVRVSSFGNKSQVKYVEMPEIEDDIPQQQNSKPANQNSIQTKKNTSSNRRFKAHNNQSSSNSSINNVNSSNNISDNNSPENQSKPLKKLPTLVRVNSFGNKAELKMVEMPLTDDDEDEEYVYSDEEFYSNEETYESNIPPRILHLMKKPRNDMVINALFGDNIGNNQRETISKVLAELKSLLNMCVDKGYLMESQYITDTIEKVKNESGGAGIFELEEKMRDVEVELQDKLKDWQRQYEKIEVEQEEKLAECDEQYKHDLENLEEQFKEERRKTSTSKLTQLRQSAQKMMKASRFEESFQLSMKIYKKEMTQSQKQARSLSNAYITAKAQLREKYEEDKNQIVLSYETKRQAVTKKREQSLAPLRDQLLQYRKMKNIYEEAEKREQAVMTTQSRMRTGQTKTERNCALPSLSSGRK
ncbi:hypothetical protein TRFO_00813 [Tritrichomonas foetus]|uniref:Uncharacterized protein n=1 Tax=Tritrichomonas foetus TaxID=1144522 RepID=A0A1J4L298_9EUKA|nr:hypothetical protein TRFO_00813 [Tritrichomonas foetus]|eukprot:OHT17571.1 hypothetical protein TRFO_00813 [Tritrichomonas foetus]